MTDELHDYDPQAARRYWLEKAREPVRRHTTQADTGSGKPREEARESVAPLMRATQAKATELGLTREERLELAFMAFGREVRSWNELASDELSALYQALRMFPWVFHLLRERL